MRILILGAGGDHRTEASIARAAVSLGHIARVLDVAGWRRRAGPLSLPLLRWQGERFAPDFIICTRHAAAAGNDVLRALCARRSSAFWYFDAASPLSPPVVRLARHTATVFATYGFQVEAFHRAGIEAHFLPQGMDPELDRPATETPLSHQCDVSFVGSGQYPRRHALLGAVAGVCRLQIRGPGWDPAPAGLPVAGGRVRSAEFARAVRGAAISLGIDALPEQRGERRGGQSNRLWRVLGMGGFFLGEYVPGVEALARAGEHAEWYQSADEAIALIRRYLGDAGQRDRVAAAGRAHALAAHTYAHRLALLLAGQGYTST
jgi:Glycosyl transferases group 1